MRRSLFLIFSAVLASAAQAQHQAVAKYEVVFDATWSAQTHPNAYVGSAHFSQLIGGTHANAGQFWSPGGIASNGIESMAESGSATTLRNEVQAAISIGQAGAVLQGGGVPLSPGMTSFQFEIDSQNPRVTLVAMIAPSPDWFVGVGGLELLEGGEWVDELSVPLLAWDSGTDNGLNLTSPNSDTNPQAPIALQNTGPFTGNDPLGTFTFRRLASAATYGSGVNPPNSIRVLSGPPTIGSNVTLGVSDPSGQLGTPLATLLFVSANSTSVTLPGFGLGPVGAPGELLIDTPILLTQTGPTISAGEASIQFGIPNIPALVGLDYFAQGALVDVMALRAGLTEGVELVIGF